MYNRNTKLVLGLVLLLGLLFQYNRMDGFTRLLSNTNEKTLFSTAAVAIPTLQQGMERECFLVIYNPIDVQSMFLKRMAENLLRAQKKEVVAVSDRTLIDWSRPYTGVLMATGNLSRIADYGQLQSFVYKGGAIVFLTRLLPDARMREWALSLGMEFVEDTPIYSRGVSLTTDFLFGAKGFQLKNSEYTTDTLPVSLHKDAICHAITSEGVPLVWETSVGKGRAIVYNGSRLGEKMNHGMMAAMVAHTKTTYLYPIIDAKVFFIDDFPSPEPEGNYDKIYEEFRLSTSEFYRQVWWPEMLSIAQRYGLKYTGLIIESYNNRVTAPFVPEYGRGAKNNLVIYGRELLKAGGELGIHGYNHQSLAPEGYAPDDLGYMPWPNQEEMVASLRELKRYIAEFYPEYEIRVYVPPSNVLSPMGKEAIFTAFPDLKIVSSLYSGPLEERAYYQSFMRNPNGTYELPRVTSGFIISEDMRWEAINVLNAQGIFSHFVHPDELYYKESEGQTWKMMREGYEAMVKDLETHYSWLRSATASEAARYLGEYLDLDYRIEEKKNELRISCWGMSGKVSFILRTQRAIDKVEGCEIRKVGDEAYLLEINQSNAAVFFKEDSAR